MPCSWNSILVVSQCGFPPLQQQSMYSATSNQLYRVAAFDIYIAMHTLEMPQ